MRKSNKTQTQIDPGEQEMTLKDKLWAFVSPVEPDGKRKSTIILYSFCLSLVFMVINLGAYVLAVPVIDGVLNGVVPGSVLQAAEILLPGLIGTAVCCLFFWLPGDKRQTPFAYFWMLGYLVAFFLTVPMLKDLTSEVRTIIYGLALSYMIVPLLTGFPVTFYLLSRYRKKHPHRPDGLQTMWPMR